MQRRNVAEPIARSAVTVLALLAMLTRGMASAAAVTEPIWTAPIAERDQSQPPPAVTAQTIVVQMTPDSLAALDANTGRRLWSVRHAVDATSSGAIVYADRPSVDPGTAPPDLVAFDVRDGHQRWSLAGAGGTLGVDGDGVIAGNQQGVTRYASDGSRRWHVKTLGDYVRILAYRDRVVTLSNRPGVLQHGEIESIDRQSGRLVGSRPWFGHGNLLGLEGRGALGASDFPGDVSMWCGDTDLLDISLDSASGPEHRLNGSDADYHLDDPSTLTAATCSEERYGPPAIVLDGAYVILASGSILGIFDRASPAGPFARYRGETFVGGPFAGRLYVRSPHGFDTITIRGAHAPRIDHLVAEPGATFAVAGIGDRLYVSDGIMLRAFDTQRFDERAEYRIGCSHLRAVTRTAMADVLVCEHETAELVALRR